MARRSSKMIGSIVLWTFYAYIWSQMAFYVACNSLRLCTRNMKSHPRGLCGNIIDEALSVICGKNGYAGKNHKRSVEFDPDMPARDAYEAYKKSQLHSGKSHIADVLLKRDQASSFLDKRTAYFTSGVSCECCYHMCTVHELKGYCRKPVNFSRFNAFF